MISYIDRNVINENEMKTINESEFPNEIMIKWEHLLRIAEKE